MTDPVGRDLARRASQQRAARLLAELEAGPRRRLRLLAVTTAGCLFFWPGLFLLLIVIASPSPGPAAWAGAAGFPALFLWFMAAAARMQAAEYRRRH